MSNELSRELCQEVESPFAGAYDDPVFELDGEGELIEVRCPENYILDSLHVVAGEPQVLGMQIWD